MVSYISRVVRKQLLGEQNQVFDSCRECALLVTLGVENEYQVKQYGEMKPLAQFWIIHQASDTPLEGFPALVESLFLMGFLSLCFSYKQLSPFLSVFHLKETKEQKQKKNEVIRFTVGVT